ncbi:related to vacuolar aspartyl aminopeptidase Lap4 [Rhynchosporium secalis]|uniref:Related to vacuolar aspartyl aminopeptidase Lap4 n=1 Tax=Rhynchosporium secalis TaxID=38038 RepID=A0A1E1MMX6_RHYSE|nr:related to vacuolar aspartyl aminopeptidase Lap4 [Rhynchosporium secalis]
MVRNGTNSLRGSVSTLSLRPKAETDNERAARERIAELEVKLAAAESKITRPVLNAPAVNQQTGHERVVKTLNMNPPRLDSYGIPTPAFLPYIAGDAPIGETMEEMIHRYRRSVEDSMQQMRQESNALEDTFQGKSGCKSLFEKFNESRQFPRASLISNGLKREGSTLKAPEAYCQPFCDFLSGNPTVFHAVDYFESKLEKAGFTKLSERKAWTEGLKVGGKYFTTRNGSSLIAFTVGGGYNSGNGVAMVAGHVDALTARLKPVSTKKTTAGYVQLGVSPYAGGLNTTWWDRDLGIGGRVLVKDPDTGKIVTKLVKLGWPIAKIPTLAPHFGVGMLGTNNPETEAVPIIGLDDDHSSSTEEFENQTLGGVGSFTATQPPKLVRAIAGELSIQDYSSIVNWELELYDIQPAQCGGLEKEFIFGGRIDDKICSWAAIEGLLATETTSDKDGLIKLVGVFDDEEIGSQLRQGAKSNFLSSVVERIAEGFSKSGSSANILSQTYANSFLISADVTHAVNPNFLGRYLENHAPRLNVGMAIAADSNGHMTTDSVSTALLTRVAEKCGSKLQIFQIRNDSRSGGTVGPMLSSAMGVRAIDAGIAQLSMHSIRATVGSKDPGLGVKLFKGYFDHFESVDTEFE